MSEVIKVAQRTQQPFTIISNKILFDKRLSAKATMYLLLMLAVPPTWNYTIAGLATLKSDGVDSVRSAIKELEKFGYVSHKRARNEKGQMKGTEYLIYEEPEQNPEYIKKLQEIELEKCVNTEFQPKRENPTQVEKCVNTRFQPKRENPILGFPTLENPTQLNTNISNTNNINYLYNNLSNQDINNNIYNSKPYFDKKIDEIDYQKAVDKISKQINAHELYKNYSRKEVDELIDVIAGVYLTKAQAITVQSIMLDTELVRSRLKTLKKEHISYVLDCLKSIKTKIKNRKNYLLTALYNAPMSLHSNKSSSDLSQDKSTSYDLDEFEEYARNFHPRI